MVNKRIEDLFQFIESTANSIMILEGTDMPQVLGAISGKTPLPENCPSKASFVEFILRGLAGRTDELRQLMSDLINEVAKAEESGEL